MKKKNASSQNTRRDQKLNRTTLKSGERLYHFEQRERSGDGKDVNTNILVCILSDDERGVKGLEERVMDFFARETRTRESKTGAREVFKRKGRLGSAVRDVFRLFSRRAAGEA
ncbi:hypothetical protein ED733_008733 [Metarhizium rileyi]|uniref:Uncharacterized protein n=1 Tax=Metarhizium rileyi (strain RCEF 4871) TaxID=1649241 RepID=A0A5C6GNP2_METRR|nr:hypothetical protein ED733_008733 [Metarhizium rileyi]